jgi:hypothetical protein
VAGFELDPARSRRVIELLWRFTGGEEADAPRKGTFHFDVLDLQIVALWHQHNVRDVSAALFDPCVGVIREDPAPCPG